MLKSESNYSYSYENSYEIFMRKHLQHYGFYKGNKLILRELEGYEKAPEYPQSDEYTSESEMNVKNSHKIAEPVNLRTTQVTYDYFEDGRSIRKLKAPHNYVLNLQQPPRWPMEMQVVPEKIHHISILPENRELIYNLSGSEIKPQPKGKENGRLIFEYNTYCGPFFTKSKSISTEIKDLRPFAVESESESDDTLRFESRFESGNLERVYQISPFEYELYLRPDMYTSKHTQWYYFRASNTRANKMYRFTIVNFYKADSLYNEGLKPLLYSEKDALLTNKGWRRCGMNIAYYRNNLKYTTKTGDRNYYSLTWNCILPHDKDTIFFSHCYPYTYSNLMSYVDNVSKDPVKNKICRIKLLTRTMADNISLLLTITNFLSNEEGNKKKKVIVITGRVHPGETNASWMMEGILDFLLSNKPDAMLLRDMFIFKIVPMLNPDGVIVGNYRCSLTGRDLNRNYKSQLKDYYPIIYSIRNLIDKLIKEKEILFYCDLHGHSRKKNIFIYGCNDQKDENEFLLERAFPFILGKNAPDKFDYRSCKFKMQKNKSGTSRIVFRNIGIPHSFTLEASFCGSSLSKDSNGNTNSQFYHFNTDDLKMMGESFCYSLLDFCDPDQTQMNIILSKIKEDLIRKYANKQQIKGTVVDVNKINILDIAPEDESSDADGGSDSSDSNGLPSHFEYMENNKLKKKAKRKVKQNAKNNHKEEGFEHTCSNLLHSRPTGINSTSDFKTKLVNINENNKRKFKTPSPKNERSCDEKEKTVILPRCFTNNSLKKISPNLNEDSFKAPLQELEASKILLTYSGTSRYKPDNCVEAMCPFHRSELLKEKYKKMNQYSNFQIWKPTGNQLDQIEIQKPIRLKNLNLPKSGLPTNTFQILSLNNVPNTDFKQKNNHYATLNPINKNPANATTKKAFESTEESKTSNKPLSVFNAV